MVTQERTKRFAKKVKTGCLTCRIRRVKCDEAKPVCLRCEKFGSKCEGYDGNAPRAEANSTLQIVDGLVKIAPKNRLQSSSVVIPRSLASFITKSTIDLQYFRQFREQTSLNFANYFKDTIWSDIVLQASHSSSGIWDAIIGLAALDRTAQSIQGSSEAQVHHQIAIKKYGRSLREMSKSLEREVDFNHIHGIRHILIFALLSFCFEAWKGYLESAISQVRYGLKYVRTWLDVNTSSLSQGDKELMQFFNRLENSTVVNLGSKIGNSAFFFRSQWSRSIDEEIPHVFDNVEDARVWHEVLVRSMIFLLLQCHRQFVESATLAMTTGLPPPPPPPEVSNQVADSREFIVGKFEQWHLAFQPLLQKSRESHNSSTFAAATALELRFKSSSRCLSGSIGLSETHYDFYHDDFRESITLAQQLIDYQKEHFCNDAGIATFTIDGSIVPSMYAISIKCRDPVIRRQAVELLEKNPRREGLWDSSLIAKIGRLSMEIEEEGLEWDEIVPEEARIVSVGEFSSMFDRRGVMKYVRHVKADGSMPFPMLVEKQISFRW